MNKLEGWLLCRANIFRKIILFFVYASEAIFSATSSLFGVK
jgi:hypothetical protein